MHVCILREEMDYICTIFGFGEISLKQCILFSPRLWYLLRAESRESKHTGVDVSSRRVTPQCTGLWISLMKCGEIMS